jgi:hypothetical protein
MCRTQDMNLRFAVKILMVSEKVSRMEKTFYIKVVENSFTNLTQEQLLETELWIFYYGISKLGFS